MPKHPTAEVAVRINAVGKIKGVSPASPELESLLQIVDKFDALVIPKFNWRTFSLLDKIMKHHPQEK